MLFDDLDIRESMRRMACQMAIDPALRDDLVQEALIHLWLREQACPGHPPAWYTQSCRFHLKNYLRGGRSVDSPKRFRGRRPANESSEEKEAAWDDTVGSASLLSYVSVREICALLSPRLSVLERQILACLTDGLGMREIALRLGVSHTLVIQRRQRIAALAIGLGVLPMPKTCPAAAARRKRRTRSVIKP
jgi:RNA polymerase sigma factor (sigma-70 family)